MKKQQKTTLLSLFSTQQIYKAYHGNRRIIYINSKTQKIKQKGDLIAWTHNSTSSNDLLLLFFYKFQNKHRSNALRFLLLLPHQRAMSTQKSSSYRGVHHPCHFKQEKKLVATGFLLWSSEGASIQSILPF